MQDAKHSSQVEVTTSADETKDVDLIKIHEAPIIDVPFSVAPVDKQATEMSFVKHLFLRLLLPLKLL